MQYFDEIIFDDVANDAVVYLPDPPKGWANISDCGKFPCTAPQNVVMQFSKVTCTGTKQPAFCSINKDFTIVSKRRGDSKAYDQCVLNKKWNGYLCTTADALKIGQLIFESLDGDTWDRSV